MNYIGKLIRIGNSQIIELNKDVGCFFYENSPYFPIAYGIYATRQDYEEQEYRLKLGLPTATLLTSQPVLTVPELALSVFAIEIMLAPTALNSPHLA